MRLLVLECIICHSSIVGYQDKDFRPAQLVKTSKFKPPILLLVFCFFSWQFVGLGLIYE